MVREGRAKACGRDSTRDGGEREGDQGAVEGRDDEEGRDEQSRAYDTSSSIALSQVRKVKYDD